MVLQYMITCFHLVLMLDTCKLSYLHSAEPVMMLSLTDPSPFLPKYPSNRVFPVWMVVGVREIYLLSCLFQSDCKKEQK